MFDVASLIAKEISNPEFPFRVPKYRIGARISYENGVIVILDNVELEEMMASEDYPEDAKVEIMCDCDTFARDWCEEYCFLQISVGKMFGDSGWKI